MQLLPPDNCKIKTSQRNKALYFLLLLIFPGSILIDLSTGFTQLQLNLRISVAPVYRTALMIWMMWLILRRQNDIFRKTIFFPILFLLIAFPCWLINIGINNIQGFQVGIEIESFSKIIYFFIVVCFFVNYRYELLKFNLAKIIGNYGFIISTALILSFISGYGNLSHGGDYGFGTKSYFKAGNDLGLTIIYSLVVYSLDLVRRFNLVHLLKVTVIACGGSLIGTRVGLVGSLSWIVILIIYLGFIYSPSSANNKRSLKKFKIFGFPLLALGIIRFISFIISSFDKYMLIRFSLEGIKNARYLLSTYALEYFSSLEGLLILSGSGMSLLYQYVGYKMCFPGQYRMVEADLHELLGGYGVVGLLILFSPFIYFLVRAIKRISKSNSFENFSLLFITSSFIFIAFTAGHCIRNTMVAPIYAYAVSLLFFKNGKHNKNTAN
ncbi:MAG: hypothetical protein HDS16_02040 [Bacteroides sp.]|nr:hypothetical protein [Bacteroides sp.]